MTLDDSLVVLYLTIIIGAGMVTIKFLSESPTFKENLNQASSISLLMTSSTALANEGLFQEVMGMETDQT